MNKYLLVVLLIAGNASAMVTDVTRDTFGVYEQCMNGNLKKFHTTTKEVVKTLDRNCVEVMQNTPTYKNLDLTNQSAVNQRTLKFRAELLEIAK